MSRIPGGKSSSPRPVSRPTTKPRSSSTSTGSRSTSKSSTSSARSTTKPTTTPGAKTTFSPATKKKAETSTLLGQAPPKKKSLNRSALSTPAAKAPGAQPLAKEATDLTAARPAAKPGQPVAAQPMPKPTTPTAGETPKATPPGGAEARAATAPGAEAKAATDKPAGAVAPETYQQLTHADGAQREAAFKQVAEAAAKGDADAQKALAQMAGEYKGLDYKDPARKAYDALDYDTRNALQKQAVETIAKQENPGELGYQTLTDALQGVYTREAAEKALTDAVKRGDPAALDALRKGITGRYGVNHEPADILAQAGDQLKDSDYALLAKAGLGQIGDSPARDTLTKAFQAGNPAAQTAVRDVLSQEKGDYTLDRKQQDAAKILAQSPEQITAQDVQHLQRHAIESDERDLKRASIDALAAGAMKQPPVEGSQEAFRQALEKNNALDMADGYNPGNEAMRKYGDKVFANATDPALKQKLAPYALNYTKDPKVAQEALALAEKGAAAGDPQALQALVKNAANEGWSQGKATSDALDRLAQGGKAGEVTDALLKQFRSDHDDRGNVLESLGRAASHLPAGDARMDDVRKTLRDGLQNRLGQKDGHDSAARGMEALASQLKQEDVDALMGQLSPSSGKALAAAADHMQPAQREALKAGLREKLDGNSRRGALEAMAGMPEHLNQEDVAAIADKHRWASDFDLNATSKALTSVLDSKGANAEAKAAAAQGLLASPERLNQKPEARQSLVNHAAASGDDALKKQVIDALPQPAVNSAHLEKIADTYSRTVSSHIKHAREGSDWHELGKLLTAKHMAKNDPEWGKHVDVAAVDRKINELVNGGLKDDFAQIRQRSIWNSVPDDLGMKQDGYVRSDAFQQRLQLLSPEEQKRAIAQELGKLKGVAPHRVQDAADHIAGRAIQDNALPMFQSMKDDPKQQANALQSALQNAVKGTNITVGTTNKIAGLLNKMDEIKDPAKVAAALEEGLSDMQQAAQKAGDAAEAAEASRALRLIKDLNANGKFGTVLSGASLLGLAAGGVPKDGKEWASAASSLLGAAGNASDIGKVLRVAGDSKIGSALKFMDWMGPAGDLLGAGVDAYGSWKDFEQGDYHGGGAKAVGAASGLVGAGAGIAILAGASGPAAPAVLLGATVVGLGALAWDSFFGKAEEQSFLENLGVYK